MVDLTMGLALMGFASGFLGWAGLLGSANESAKLMFFALLGLAAAMALAMVLAGIWRAVYRRYRAYQLQRTRYSGRLHEAP
jgi:membrane protein implicated in regulation of membrane protease activity